MANVGTGRPGGGITPYSGSVGGGSSNFMSSLGNMFSGMDFGDMFSNLDFGDLLKGGSLALNAYGMNKSLGFAEDQLGILEDQEARAAAAQNFSTGNSLAMARQMTTPGTPESQRIEEAIANGTYQV